MIQNANAWYDRQREPWRMLIAIGLIQVPLALIAFGTLPLQLAGVALIGGITFARLS